MATDSLISDEIPQKFLARGGDYWEISRRPLISLVFIAPMLVVYEVGVLLLPRGTPRNGADVWLRSLLDWVGVGQYFMLPVLTCGMLLAWHYLRRDPWTIRKSALGWMVLEAVGLAWALLLLAQWQGALFGKFSVLAAGSGSMGLIARMIAFLGAGIYEELLFRLMLLPLAIAGFKLAGLSPRGSVIAGVILVSLIFSAAHYRLDLAVGPWHVGTQYGDAWNLRTFVFRFLAGVFFAVLFHYRGFGITAGSHALYDLATVWW